MGDTDVGGQQQPDNDEVEVSIPVVVLYQLPRKPKRESVLELVSSLGTVVSCCISMGRGLALVQMSTIQEASLVLHNARQGKLWYGHRQVKAAQGTVPVLERDLSTPEYLRSEVTRCLDDLVRLTATRYGQYRRELRLERRRVHRGLLHVLEKEARESGAIDFGVCWDYARHRQCPRASSCPFEHPVTPPPLSALPLSQRLTEDEADRFPCHREANPHKARVNAILVRLSSTMRNKRCLVLDGPAANTVRALRSCPIQQRESSDICVPNIVTSTFLALQRTGLCHVELGSLRAFLDAHPDQRFGLMYLDYCARLYAGKGDVERSPIQDLRRLLSLHLPDPQGCILAVCLREEEQEQRPAAAAHTAAGAMPDNVEEEEEEALPSVPMDAPQRLRHLVCRFAAESGLVAIPHVHGVKYPGCFVEIFYVSEPGSQASYWGLDVVKDALGHFLPPEDDE